VAPDRTAGVEVPSIAFDTLIRHVTDDGKRRVACLKIDCVGAVFPILLTSRCLHLIDYICGEFHEFRDGIPEHARVDGFARFSIEELTRALNQQGFAVAVQRHGTSHMGLFFARNTSDLYLMQQLSNLRQHFELRPQARSDPLVRLRSRLAWWLLAPEIQQINQAHAATLRILDSLVARLERERTARKEV
jgi:hypothetical protein